MAFLSTVPAGVRGRRLAAAVVLTSLLAFVVTAPFAKLPLTPVPAFLPAYQTAIVIGDLITFLLLLGQYDILRSRAVLCIACGYLFNATMAVLHALSFPGLLAPTGLLGSGPQTTAWLYFFWHGSFPLFVIACVLLKHAVPSRIERSVPLAWATLVSFVVTLALAGGFLWLATRGSWLLPAIMSGDRDADAKVDVALIVWAISLAALALLWRRKPHSSLDTWLMVILCVWILDVALAAVLNGARYDVGWYMGRAYGLVAATVVLLALMLENCELHGQLACASAMERAYLSHLPDPVVTIDSRGTIWNANHALERVLGYPMAELLGRNVSVLMPEPARSGHDNHIDRYMKTGQSHLIGTSREVVAQHRNGALVPLEVSLSEFVHDGESFFVGAFRDLRDRNRLIDDLTRARADAEQANRAKSAFLATMSHEIRTPMNGVIGMVDLLAQGELTEHQADAVQTIKASAFALLGLIDDILDFSKIEAGRLELERAPVALCELIEGICSTLLPVAVEKDVELNLFVQPELPARIQTDATRLRQVLFNLIGNAIKFSAGRPNLRGRIQVTATLDLADGPWLRVEVVDNGIGIAPEVLPHLFSAFTQAEASTTRRFGGTGLGLAISQRLVSLMQGSIEVSSTFGAGSRFRVSLPIEAARAPPGAAAPAELAGLVCIVVGSGIEPEYLRRYLEHAGVRVTFAGDLGEAVALCADLAAERPVVIHNNRRQAPTHEQLNAAFGRSGDVRHLVITRDLRGRGRAVSGDLVVVDGACLRRAALLRGLAVAAGKASPEVFHLEAEEDGPEALATPLSIAEGRARGRLLLVAEDDEINQKVILRQIQVLGYAAEIADNGLEVLRLWRTGQHALLLTDLHMPHMDGYALAQAIRAEEAGRPGDEKQRLPIIALTANALRGESARAQAAGMDDYLTKPVQLKTLRAVLRNLLPETDASSAHRAPVDPPSAAADSPVLDLSIPRSLVAGDEQLVNELVEQFGTTATRQAAELRSALAADDLRQVGSIAHKLKSAARSIGALRLGDCCAELENAVRSAGREEAAQAAQRLERALQALQARLEDRGLATWPGSGSTS